MSVRLSSGVRPTFVRQDARGQIERIGIGIEMAHPFSSTSSDTSVRVRRTGVQCRTGIQISVSDDFSLSFASFFTRILTYTRVS